MAVFHDEVEIEDFEYDEETETYSYPCPCGDRFLITREDLENGEDVATCPSCSLILRVIYDQHLKDLKTVVDIPSRKELWDGGDREDPVEMLGTSALKLVKPVE
ncbi:DPH3 like protein [Turdus rufiventris]|nr:DPH3 like protein [Turdus rufiventris]